MYRIINTADDRTKHLLHRVASKFELEPNLGGNRIRLGSYLDIQDDHYARVKPTVDEWVKKGMVDVIKISNDVGSSIEGPRFDEAGLQLGGPTLEEWTAAGYPVEGYPPRGYADVFSPGLVALRRAQEEASQETARQAAEVIKEALVLPTVPEQILPATPVIEPVVADGPSSQEPVSSPVPVSTTSTSTPKSKKRLV